MSHRPDFKSQLRCLVATFPSQQVVLALFSLQISVWFFSSYHACVSIHSLASYPVQVSSQFLPYLVHYLSCWFFVLFYCLFLPQNDVCHEAHAQFSSVTQSCPTFWTPWTAAHQVSRSIINLLKIMSHVHRVGDAIQPSHPLSSLSPPAFSLSRLQGLFQ